MNDAIKKATEYCLNCRVKPCSIKGCPLNNNIPAFIKLVKEENLKDEPSYPYLVIRMEYRDEPVIFE